MEVRDLLLPQELMVVRKGNQVAFGNNHTGRIYAFMLTSVYLWEPGASKVQLPSLAGKAKYDDAFSFVWDSLLIKIRDFLRDRNDDDGSLYQMVTCIEDNVTVDIPVMHMMLTSSELVSEIRVHWEWKSLLGKSLVLPEGFKLI